ncbi:MAG: hypothetical protein ABSH52_24995, partial [Terriglobia bacterium]
SWQSLMPVGERAPGNHENRPTVDGCGAGVPPAVARASCPCTGARRSRDRGRDARATIFRAVRNYALLLIGNRQFEGSQT